MGSHLDGLLPKSLFAFSKAFFDKSKACSRCFQNSPFGLKQLKALIFHFAKIYLQKSALMTAQRDLGKSPLNCGEYRGHILISALTRSTFIRFLFDNRIDKKSEGC